MKKILFVVCACLTLAACTCKSGNGQHDQDTVVIEDTVNVEEFDTLFVD